MKKNLKSLLASCGLLGLCLVAGCGSSDGEVITGNTNNGQTFTSVLFQNPFLSPNPGSNIHNDSYLSDTYEFAGPTSFSSFTLQQNNQSTFVDPYTGTLRTVILGEGAGQAYDADGNIQTVTTGVTDPSTNEATRSIVTLDKQTLSVLAWFSFQKEQTSLTDFGGAGYFYQDEQFRMVSALPDGHVKVLQRQDSLLSTVDQYVAVRDINIAGPGGAVPIPNGLTSLSLYALMPDKVGNIWFTIGEGIVGVINPAGNVRYLDTNDPTGTGTRTPEPDGDFESIANSHAVDEGDSADGSSGIYILSTHKMYRFGLDATGNPQIVWEAAYDRGTGIKPGQVSFGSGTSPTVFRMAGRRFVAIADNAANGMNVNVYRAEATLAAGEQRLFAQVAPFGSGPDICDENSLIAAPATDGSGGYDLFAENNFGYTGFDSVAGAGVTTPGFARMRLLPNGNFTVASVNNSIRVPTIVSKMSKANNTVYTYEKRTDGWFLTGLDATDLNSVRFSVPVGPGTAFFNNHYAALSLDPDGRSVWFGTAFGVTKVSLRP